MVRAIAGRFWSGAFHQEEAIQDIWVHVFKQRESLDPARLAEFGAWLTALCRNRAIDLLRKEGRTIGPSAEDPVLAVERIQTSPAQVRAVEDAELRAALQSFKERLKPRWQTFFALHFVEGLGYPEVMTRLSISQARCKYMKRVLVRRARRDERLTSALGRRRHAAGGSDAP
jgi:RNA polymerase sigma-70 factor (ECF subfamily)